MSDPMPLRGRSALVTDASRGVGRSIAVTLAAAGADVFLVARSTVGLAATSSSIAERGGRSASLVADLADPRSAELLVARVGDAFGGLDIVVNSACAPTVDVESLDGALWRRALRLSLEAAAEVCRTAGPLLRASRHGAVLNIASAAALGRATAPSAYRPGSAALVSLTRSLAVHWAADGVRVNALCPAETSGATGVALRDLYRETARQAVFLVGDAAAYVTGQALLVETCPTPSSAEEEQ